jgi:hypothetical protein
VVDVAEHMQLITLEARRVRKLLPQRHLIELCDLVSAGAEHVLAHLRFNCNVGPACVRVYARQGMIAEVRRWDHGTKKHPVHVDRFVDVFDPAYAPKAFTPRPPIELMIDLLRELLKLRLADALAWTVHRLNDDDHQVSARELGEASSSQRNRVARAASALRTALRDYAPNPCKTRHQRAVELFRQGASCEHVARAVKMCPVGAARIQDSIDPAAKRRRAAQAELIRGGRKDIRDADVVSLRSEGLTMQAIADRLGCGTHLVQCRMKKLGLDTTRIDSRRRHDVFIDTAAE